MAFLQHANVCDEHETCTVIVGEADGHEVWRSHMPATVAPEIRINVDYPEIEDRRGPQRARLPWRLARDDEAQQLGWDDEMRRRAAFAATISATNPATAREMAGEFGETPEQFAADAVDRGIHRAHNMDEAAVARAANVAPAALAAARAARRGR